MSPVFVRRDFVAYYTTDRLTVVDDKQRATDYPRSRPTPAIYRGGSLSRAADAEISGAVLRHLSEYDAPNETTLGRTVLSLTRGQVIVPVFMPVVYGDGAW